MDANRSKRYLSLLNAWISHVTGSGPALSGAERDELWRLMAELEVENQRALEDSLGLGHEGSAEMAGALQRLNA